MNVLVAVFEELFSMFVGDARLTVGILVVVGAASVSSYFALSGLAGGVLVFGCLALLLDSVLHAARRKR